MSVRSIQKECLKMNYKYHSILKDVIIALIEEKRSLGFIYEVEEYKFKQLDILAIKENLSELVLSKDFVYKFIAKKTYEKKYNAVNRVPVIRELAKYMIRKGYNAYIIPPLPRGSYQSDFIPHIFSDSELKRLFKAVDEWSTSLSLDGQYYIQREKYPVILRILYSTGMRISEVLSLKVENIDFKNHTFTILDAKNHSERVIPVHMNTLNILNDFINSHNIFVNNEFIFKGQKHKSHLSRKTIEYHFLHFLQLAEISHPKDGPRIHSFRHTFCVHRLRFWVLEGRDITALFPYLCAYMGHADTRSTEYYLRLTADLYPDIIIKSEVYLYGGEGNE